MTILTRNNDGFTLTEVMVAIVIMMVGLLGLLEAGKAEDDQYDYYVCPVCGHTHARSAPDRCPVCGTAGTRFEKIN